MLSSLLLHLLHFIHYSVQSRQQTAIVYIDFAKAFDVVSHKKLLAKLYTYGIRGTVLLWIKSFFFHWTHAPNQSWPTFL